MSRQRMQLNSFPIIYWHILVECIHHHNDPHFKLSFTLPDVKMAISFRHRFHSFRSALSRRVPSAAQAMYNFIASIYNNQTVVIEAGFADIMSLKLKPPLQRLDPSFVAITAERLKAKLTGMQPMTMQDVNTLLGPTPQAAFTGVDTGAASAEGVDIPDHIRALIRPEMPASTGEPQAPLPYPNRRADDRSPAAPSDQDQAIRDILGDKDQSKQ